LQQALATAAAHNYATVVKRASGALHDLDQT